MSLVSTLHSPINNSLRPSTEVHEHDGEAALSSLLGAFTNGSPRHSMERGAPEYSQSGLQTPYPNALNNAQSEGNPADHASAVQSNNTFPSSATPTSEYGVHPTSARSSTFPEHIQRQQYYPSSSHSGSSGGMAQTTSPSMPLQDGRSSHHNQSIKSDADVPIDPSIAASSPTYPPHGGQYSPYPPQQEMSHGYPQHPGGPMYAQPRPDWAGYGQQPHHGMPAPYQTTGVSTPTSAAPAGARPGQVSYLLYSADISICLLPLGLRI
jgi:transcription factor CON7